MMQSRGTPKTSEHNHNGKAVIKHTVQSEVTFVRSNITDRGPGRDGDTLPFPAIPGGRRRSRCGRSKGEVGEDEDVHVVSVTFMLLRMNVTSDWTVCLITAFPLSLHDLYPSRYRLTMLVQERCCSEGLPLRTIHLWNQPIERQVGAGRCIARNGSGPICIPTRHRRCLTAGSSVQQKNTASNFYLPFSSQSIPRSLTFSVQRVLHR